MFYNSLLKLKNLLSNIDDYTSKIGIDPYNKEGKVIEIEYIRDEPANQMSSKKRNIYIQINVSHNTKYENVEESLKELDKIQKYIYKILIMEQINILNCLAVFDEGWNTELLIEVMMQDSIKIRESSLEEILNKRMISDN